MLSDEVAVPVIEVVHEIETLAAGIAKESTQHPSHVLHLLSFDVEVVKKF